MKKECMCVLGLIALATGAAHSDGLAERFMNPAPEARPWLYWYWMNGNVTREGIHADLQAFADVGIGGAMLFDIGIHPAGAVTNRNREWYELVQFATAEAAQHGVKMSFHCPGWSASGGPWITPELAMQEVTWSETVVEGPCEFTVALPQPPARLGFYRDAAVIAFPTPAGDEPLPKPQLADTNGTPFPAGTTNLPAAFDLVFPQPVEARSAFVRVARATSDFAAELSVFDERAGQCRTVAKFRSHTSGPFSAHIGSASFAPMRGSRFRLSFTGRKVKDLVVIEQLELFGGYRVPEWTSKAGFATDRVEPRPAAPTALPADMIAPDRIVDLTGKVSWPVPSGRWTILRIGHTPTGVHIFPPPLGGDGLECDKLSREVADFHYDQCVKPMLSTFGPELTKKAVAYYHVDSYEAGWQNWSEKLPLEFRTRRGYDLAKYLPALTGRVVCDLATTEKFLWDFRRTIGDLFADNHYGRLAQRSHEDGVRFSTEPYGGPFECLQVGARADHPMVEFWLPGKAKGPKQAFHGVFAGRTTERPIIGAESFTSGPPEERWTSHPFSLKALGDFMYCSGVNRFVIHVSAHQPLIGEHLRPGVTCGGNGIHFDRGNTWYQHGAKDWTTYLTRCQSLLQAGEPAADALYFQGNDSPSSVGPFLPALPEGYDFDACGSEVLDGLRVKDGLVLLPRGKSYRYLVLPNSGWVTLASLRKIVALASGGAKVVGTMPKESPSLADVARRNEYEAIIKELSGHVNTNRSFKTILAVDNLPPDFDFDAASGLFLHSAHRRADGADIYFVASASQQSGRVDCRFRVTGKLPELWDAATGQICDAASWRTENGVTVVPLQFDPSGSVFVIFRKAATSQPAAGCNWSDYRPLQEMSAPWTLEFPVGWGAPNSVTLDRLVSWSDHADTGVRYFSGTATYRKVFVFEAEAGRGELGVRTLAPHNRYFLDLGRVEVIAEVRLNGKSLGTLWKPPFRVDVTDVVKNGDNVLEVRVTNLWPNRLIGDEQFPDDCNGKDPWPDGGIRAWPDWVLKNQPRPEPRRQTFSTWKHWTKTDPLLPSGLLGPVTIQVTEQRAPL